MRNDIADRGPPLGAKPRWPGRDTSDAVLMAKIAAGNRLAIQVLYARHHTRIYRFLLRRCGEPALAEALVTDVFVSAWRHAHRFDGSSRAATWLLAIARRKAELQSDELAPVMGHLPTEAGTTSRHTQRSERLRACLARLPREQREILDLVYYHGKSPLEIASIIGISPEAVRARMLHARCTLTELSATSAVTAAPVEFEGS
jgi:RNA polymerase sigma-70 factor, ECF subfamily